MSEIVSVPIKKTIHTDVVVAGGGTAGCFAAISSAAADANLTELSGYPCVQSDDLQPASLITKISGYDPKALDGASIETAARKAMLEGRLPALFRSEDLHRFLQGGEINFHTACEDAASSKGKTALEIKARKELMLVIAFLRELPGLENILSNSAVRV